MADEPKVEVKPFAMSPEQLALVEQSNVANIIKKIKAGKTLTASDRAALQAVMPTPEAPRPKGYVKAIAEYWCVSLRVMQKWLAAKVPVDSDEGMRSWYATLPPDTQNKLTPAFREKIVGGGKTAKPDADDKEFTAVYSEAKGEKSVLSDLKRQMAFYLFRHRKASVASDGVKAAEAMRQIKELSSIIHDMEMRAFKLGRDLGDLVPRADLERPARFMAYHLLRCADAALGKLAKAITERDPKLPPVTAPEVRALGEPLLLTAMVWEPIERAAKGDNSAAPPEWLVAALKAGRAEVVE